MSDQPATLFLSRHGQTSWQREQRYAGISDIDLDQTGRRQARSLADWTLRYQPARVVSSPLRRARQTALASAAVIAGRLEIVTNLREVDFGVAEGRTRAELNAADEDIVRRFERDPVSHPFPDAESTESAARRGAEALCAVAAASPGSVILVVAHNTLLRLALCVLLGIEVPRYRSVFPVLDNGTLSELRLGAALASAALLSLNVPIEALQPSAERPR